MRNTASGNVHWSRLRRFASACGLLLSAYCLSAVSAQAHDAGLSTADLLLEEDHLTAQLAFARGDIEALVPIDTNADGQVTPAELNAARPRLEALASAALEVRFDEHRPGAREVVVQLDENDTIYFHLSFHRSEGLTLNLRSAIIARLAPGHRQYLSIRDESGNMIGQRLLAARGDVFETNLVGATASRGGPKSSWQFLVLGVEHILIGYDHLAFLFVLLLAGDGLREVAKIVTSFTLAHSLTLALATFDLLQVPSRVVEPLIAISIIYVSLENILRGDLKWRWLLTFGFGLVHGLGFAAVLRELGVGSGIGRALMPLLSFNIGVEVGQLIIAAMILPLIWKLRARPTFVARYVPACSALVALTGSYWLIERTLLR